VSTIEQQPPAVFRLAGHPLRWQLISVLARSDRRVRELAVSLGEQQPLVSYHLRQLRRAGLVAMRQSSFDGRDSYYSLDLDRCSELLTEAGAAIHPGLSLETRSPAHGKPSRTPRVLFLCTGNSSRSQMAEALMRELSDGTVEAFSAGSRPKPIHRNALLVMKRRGIDISKQEPKHLDSFRQRHVDYVISLCDRVREVCPEFPGNPDTVHWSIPDPAAEPGSDRETYPAFERTAAELETRIRYLLHQISNEKGA
jgi:ArsR family transcriptional regulator, arsenate/arsenite/antimonite-responsive transcriptional repressor / arsenate reductase (thioredoxin)